MRTILPDGTSLTNMWYTNGLRLATYGSRTYPIGYSYDYAGRLKTMTNWTSFATGAGTRVTTWNYDIYRGWLTNKTFDGGAAGPSYTYTAAGRLQTRAWARGVLTTNSYDGGGGLSAVTYSDSTPAVTNGIDRLGRQSAVTNGSAICLYAYDLANDLLSATNSTGPLAGFWVTNGYDQFLRRTNLTVLNGSTNCSSTAYTYTNGSRLSTVSDGTNAAAYTYIANSALVGQIAFTSNGVARMTTTKQFDNLNRLLAITNTPSGAGQPVFSYAYQYNSANQRSAVTNADGSFWIYSYDALGQVVSGNKYWSDGTSVAGQQFDYTFDDIGNRTQTMAGGDAWGNNLRRANYNANNLNQYTNLTVPGYTEVLGSANSNATVTLWGSDGGHATTSRKGNYFRGEYGLNNSTGAVWLTITNVGVLNQGTNSDLITNETGNVFVPRTPEAMSYDADGNLTNDGRWTYAWDAENRLIGMTTNTASGPGYHLTLSYDSQGRRIQKIVATNGVAYSTNNFLYDGWNLIAETASSGSLIRSYLWGLDLSGSIQGAGGVGGLLQVNYSGSAVINCFVAYDGNGNVTALVNAADGTGSAQYEYGPFGEVARATGPMAKANPFRFSTKYQDDETVLLYYGHRYLDAMIGRWLCPDPLQETAFGAGQASTLVSKACRFHVGGAKIGGPILVFCDNAPLNTVEFLGLCTPGDKNASCVVRVTPAGIPADTKEKLDELAELAETTDHFGVLLESGATGAAAFTKIEELLAEAAGGAANTASTAPGPAIQKAVKGLLDKMGPHNGGWVAWIQVSGAICKRRCALGRFFTGEDGYWKDQPSDGWQGVGGGGDLGQDDLGHATYDDPSRAFTAGTTACSKALKAWKNGN